MKGPIPDIGLVSLNKVCYVGDCQSRGRVIKVNHGFFAFLQGKTHFSNYLKCYNDGRESFWLFYYDLRFFVLCPIRLEGTSPIKNPWSIVSCCTFQLSEKKHFF